VPCSGSGTPASPMGLRTRESSSSSVGCRALSVTITAVPAPATSATGRQRADSSRPVGNTSRVNTNTSTSVGYHHHEVYQAARTAPGIPPGRARLAYAAYSVASTPVAVRRPTAEKIQPTALPGRWASGAPGVPLRC
jgi:hypothetical protein